MSTDVFVDNKFYGVVENPKEFVESLREARRKGSLPKEVSIYYDKENEEIYINTTRGRLLRPLIVVKNGKPLLTEQHIQKIKKGELTWNDLVEQGIIEYLDAAEEENAYIAFSEDELTPEHTHLEISPIAMLSLATSTIPFLERNQAARLLRAVKSIKQAVGLYASNFLTRMDMDINLLHEPQIPIVTTRPQKLAKLDTHPAGQNSIVAVMEYDGYNMDDAIVINKGSIDRGYQRSSYFRTLEAEELQYAGGFVDKIGLVDKDVYGYRSEQDYRFLEEDGIAYTGAKVQENDVIIGKISPPRFLNEENEYRLGRSIWRETSVALKHGEQGVVDFVILTENEQGNRLVRVKIRDLKIPEIGDKFTSYHGQKGVIGLILAEEDMPFSASGIIPDVIFSPHSIPSRMSVSHLLEALAGKVGALSGRYVDATPFEGESEEDLELELMKRGFLPSGEETFYDGLTGRRFKARIYIGVMYYMRLRHLVSTKIHARARGKIQLLTRQPTEGRAKEGGLKLGEMEKDTFIAHGASLILKERFSSDKTLVPVCEKCGNIAIYNYFKNKYVCPVCGEHNQISLIEMSYAFKLFMDELTSLGVHPKLKLKLKYVV